MVKLTRMLKTEYRDDVGSKRNRRSGKKKSGRDADRDTSTLSSTPRDSSRSRASRAEQASHGTGPKEVNLPPALLKIIKSHAPGHSPTEEEEREQAEPSTPSGSGASPHHFALTRAAQMALRSMPIPADADERSQSSTMALIDSIVKTSDDPALIDALQVMMVEANGQSVQQRETLALVAESIMEKKAAKEALQRAVLAESRLHESLKKCAPEVVGNAAAMVAAAEVEASMIGGDAVPPAADNSNAGFFHRINKSLTGGSSKRNVFGKSKSKNRKSRSKSKIEKHSNKDAAAKMEFDPSHSYLESASPHPSNDSIVMEAVAGDVGHPAEEPIPAESFVMRSSYCEGFLLHEEEQQHQEVDERRDDQEQGHEGREIYMTEESNPPKRKNKYKHITSVEPEAPLRYQRSSSGMRSRNGQQSNHRYEFGPTASESIIDITSMEEAEDGTFVEVDGSDSENEGTEVEEESHEDDDYIETEAEVDDPTISNFGADEEAEKIEYTIFELESKVSISTYASSLRSATSRGSRTSHSEEHEAEVEQSDTHDHSLEEEAGEGEGEAGEEEEGTTCDEATEFNEDEEVTLNGAEETGASEAESCSEEEEEDDSDDDGLLFALMCQRPDASFDVDEDDHSRHRRRRHRHRHRSSRRKERSREPYSHEVPSILQCVSGYFIGGDEMEVFIGEERQRRRRRRKRRS